MAGVKISALPAIPLDLTTDIGPFVQGGITYKSTLAQISTLFNSTIQLNGTGQVTGLNTALAGLLPLAGGTMTGDLILFTSSPPTSLSAASKGYVDTVASGFTVVLACLAATTANLNATPAGAGVGATLTNAGAMAAFSTDGVSPAINSRILVKNQTLTQHNGIYDLTTVGSGAVNWVLTRSTDYDQAPAEIHPGTLVAVDTGTVNANTSWLETATVATVDTDPILFSQFTFAPAAFLMVANNLSDVANAATSRTNLGLGTAATKAASDNAKATVASVTGAFTIGHVATFSDVNGTIQDGGALSTSGQLIGIRTVKVTGLYIPTAGTNNALVRTWGAGAGGGSNTNASFCGGAGGAGAYAEGYVAVAGNVTVTIGAGGTGATLNTTNNGTPGGDTSYGATIIAKGGAAGGGAAGGATGGLGGQAASCTIPASGFALNGADGSSTNVFSGLRDWSIQSGSPGNVPGTLRTLPGNGVANSAQGGSGGSTAVAGGAGGTGLVIIYEYA